MSAQSAVVAAHPDDEILWLSSAMKAARHVVLCYGAPFDKPESNTVLPPGGINLPPPSLGQSRDSRKRHRGCWWIGTTRS